MKKAVFLALIIVFALTAPAHSKKKSRKYRSYCCECPTEPFPSFVVRTTSKMTALRKCKEMCGFDYDDPKARPPKLTWGKCDSTPDRKEEDGP